jgi:hypothetical protein
LLLPNQLKTKKHLKAWALEPDGWLLPNDTEQYNILELDENDYEKVYYKERWIKEDGLEQKLIVTYSLKYKNYQRVIRNKQIERAQSLIDSHPEKLNKTNQSEYKRFIEKVNCTTDGEIAKKQILTIDKELIAKEALLDGFLCCLYKS